jgi:hypothetical protein
LNSTGLLRYQIAPKRKHELWATYLNTAANVDKGVGDIIEAARLYLKDDTPAIIITSDHGESLFDDGYLGHGFALNETQTRIPFIVANLPLMIEQPFGQADLRHTLNRALTARARQSAVPILQQSSNRSVFQYIGSLRRPRQISLLRLSGRLTYDFRTGLVKVPGEPWRQPEDLREAEHAAFIELVHSWERMAIASAKRNNGEI